MTLPMAFLCLILYEFHRGLKKMVRIQLNNQILQRINNYQSLDKITLTINNVEISVTKSFAVAISQNFYSQYLLDNNIAKIDIQTDIKSHETYHVLKNSFERSF